MLYVVECPVCDQTMLASEHLCRRCGLDLTAPSKPGDKVRRRVERARRRLKRSRRRRRRHGYP
jgi:hypothetical protein